MSSPVQRARRRLLAAGGALALSACAGVPAGGGSAAPRASGLADVNGTRLWYEVAGAGEPVVLLHAFTLDSRMWDAQFDALARTHRVIRYDARGFGRSHSPQAGQAYAHHEDLAALLERLGAQRPHLVGHAMGGRFALDFAVSYPGRARSLVLVDTVVAGWPWSKAFLDGYAPVIAAGRRRDVAAARSAWLAHPVFGPAREQPTVMARIETMVREYSGWHFVNADPARAVVPPTLNQLAAVRVPSLVLVGERDLVDFRQMSERAARDLRARQVTVRGAGHFAPLEAAADTTTSIAEFITAS
jgi:pimeloyl-ACP methyl ester carboxylesterase